MSKKKILYDEQRYFLALPYLVDALKRKYVRRMCESVIMELSPGLVHSSYWHWQSFFELGNRNIQFFELCGENIRHWLFSYKEELKKLRCFPPVIRIESFKNRGGQIFICLIFVFFAWLGEIHSYFHGSSRVQHAHFLTWVNGLCMVRQSPVSQVRTL